MTLVRSVIVLGSALSPLLAADVTGHWILEGDVSGNPVNLDCRFKQNGVKLEGACKSTNGDVTVAGEVAGEVSDPKVRFSYAVDYQGTTYTLYYSGTLESDSAMKGDIQVNGTPGTFSARKDPAK
ncbi:MAG: hypothetical protein ABUS49_04940 [Acidobacteriota bacterium]